MCSGSNCNNTNILNVKYNLCNNCNSIRLTGKSPGERQAASALKFRNRQIEKNKDKGVVLCSNPVNSPKEKKDRGLFVRIPEPIPQLEIKKVLVKRQTLKEAGVKSKLSILKREIEMEAVQNNEYFCKGCGISKAGLDKSHILPVGQFKHLELVKENIQLLCREDHIIWESGTIDMQMNLNCFVDNVCFIHIYDKVQYQKFITRIETLLETISWHDSIQFDNFSKKYHEIISKCG